MNRESESYVRQDDLSFRSELDRLARTGRNRVVLNLNDVDDIDTTGLEKRP